MKRTTRASFLMAALATAALALAGCPKGGIPGAPGSAAGSVDPNTCGNYAASDAGRKLKAFLNATVLLDKAVSKTESVVKDTCADMGKKIGMTEAQLQGDTKTACNAVFAQIRANLGVSLKAEAKLNIDYKPAVCTVDARFAARAAAKCEAKAEADISVTCSGQCTGTCSGSCSGTCSGTCKGTCAGSADNSGADGQCAGECQGECSGSCSGSCGGSCSGGCTGNADVQASASCQAEAEVSASVDAKCTEPEVNITYDASVVVDTAKLEMTVAALKAGLPRMLVVAAHIGGPVKSAFVTWSKSGAELAKAGRSLVSSLGDQAMCVLGQIRAAVAMVADIQVSVEVQVEVSASASASAGGSGGGSASGGAGGGGDFANLHQTAQQLGTLADSAEGDATSCH